MEFLDQISDDFQRAMEQGSSAPTPAVTVTVERALLPEDIRAYIDGSGKLETAQKADEKDVRTLRARHHGVARLLAQGVPEGIVADMCNYTPQYLSVLKQNPSMIELIEHYRGPNNEAAKLIGEKLRTVGTMALERLEDRIENDELDDFALLQAAKLGFDRSGHGPQSSVHSVTEHRVVMPEELLRLSKEARRRDASHIVSVEAVRAVLPAPQSLEPRENLFDDPAEPSDE